jgi:hypothetical protein
MICSWVPKEDLRKQGQLPTKEIDNQTPLQIICKVVEQVKFSISITGPLGIFCHFLAKIFYIIRLWKKLIQSSSKIAKTEHKYLNSNEYKN